MIPDAVIIAVSVGVFVGGTVWGLALWLAGQFGGIRTLIYSQIEKLETHFTNKLEYHERHDDARFNNISNDLWELKLRNASAYLTDETKVKEKKNV